MTWRKFEDLKSMSDPERALFMGGRYSAPIARHVLADQRSVPPDHCLAQRELDQKRCRRCGLVWDVCDHEPPACPYGHERS